MLPKIKVNVYPSATLPEIEQASLLGAFLAILLLRNLYCPKQCGTGAPSDVLGLALFFLHSLLFILYLSICLCFCFCPRSAREEELYILEVHQMLKFCLQDSLIRAPLYIMNYFKGKPLEVCLHCIPGILGEGYIQAHPPTCSCWYMPKPETPQESFPAAMGWTHQNCFTDTFQLACHE